MLEAPVEMPEAKSAGRLGPSFMLWGPSACQRASQRRLRVARTPLRRPGANEPTGGGVTPPPAVQQSAFAARCGGRPAIAGEIDDVIGELVHGSPPLWYVQSRKTSGCEAYALRTTRVRASGPWTLTMFRGDESGNLSAIPPPRMVLPMSLQLG